MKKVCKIWLLYCLIGVLMVGCAENTVQTEGDAWVSESQPKEEKETAGEATGGITEGPTGKPTGQTPAEFNDNQKALYSTMKNLSVEFTGASEYISRLEMADGSRMFVNLLFIDVPSAQDQFYVVDLVTERLYEKVDWDKFTGELTDRETAVHTIAAGYASQKDQPVEKQILWWDGEVIIRLTDAEIAAVVAAIENGGEQPAEEETPGEPETTTETEKSTEAEITTEAAEESSQESQSESAEASEEKPTGGAETTEASETSEQKTEEASGNESQGAERFGKTLTGVTIYHYDQLGNESKFTGPTYTYDKNGLLKEMNLGYEMPIKVYTGVNWGSATLEYDGTGKLVQITFTGGRKTTAISTVTCDDAGRRISESILENSGGTIEINYTYDDQGRCVEWCSQMEGRLYKMFNSYDDSGNLIKEVFQCYFAYTGKEPWLVTEDTTEYHYDEGGVLIGKTYLYQESYDESTDSFIYERTDESEISYDLTDNTMIEMITHGKKIDHKKGTETTWGYAASKIVYQYE